MLDREAIDRELREHYQGEWSAGDPWGFQSAFASDRLHYEIQLLSDRRYQRALELGCGNGRFAALLGPLCDRVLALDIAEAAIDLARRTAGAAPHVEFRVANAVDFDPHEEGPWDLVVLNEMLYCVGWLYPLFDVAWMASELFAATTLGGRLLLMNTYGGPDDSLLHPHLLHTYRDLFVHVGYEIERQEIAAGVDDGEEMEVLLCLFRKTAEPRPPDRKSDLRVARRCFSS